MSFNLATMLHESARANPDKACCRLGELSVTYSELDDVSGRVAHHLLASGLERGDKVVVQLPNIPQFLEAYFGILKAGLVVVPINPLLKPAEIAYQLTDSAARAAITFDACLPGMAIAAEGVDGLRLYNVGAPSDSAQNFEVLRAAASAPSLPEGPVATGSDDTAVIIYTSGTTGRPKGAELTHFQLFMNCTTAGGIFGVQDDDVTMACLPFFHIYGLSSVVNCTIRFGGTLSVVPRFEPAAVLDAMEAHGVSVFLGVPTMYHALLQEDLTGRDLSQLRIGCSGGASMPEAVMNAFEERFGIVILEGYGLSETAATATMNYSVEERRPLSVGKPIWGVEARIVDADGKELPAGRENLGEVLLRGHAVTKGYYNDPEATAAALTDGWLHTGDLGYFDEDGFLFIADRIKDLIIRGGYNVYPREIEEVLYSHPAVAEAAVVGRADARLGEEVVAVVSLRPDFVESEGLRDEIVAFCRERLANYKCPREVRFLDVLPKNATGKILKRELRAG